MILNMTMLGPKGIQPSVFEGGLDDLESFQAWAEEIKTYLELNQPIFITRCLAKRPWPSIQLMKMGWPKTSEDCLEREAQSFANLTSKSGTCKHDTTGACRKQELSNLTKKLRLKLTQRASSNSSKNSISTSFRYKTRAASLGISLCKRPRGRPSFNLGGG